METKYNIYEVVGKNCMTPNDGKKVYSLTHPELLAEHHVELEFTGVDIFASPFFNFAIGQLLRDIQPEKLNKLLKLTNLNHIGKQVLKQVIENSKQYYSNEHTRRVIDEVVTEQAESL